MVKALLSIHNTSLRYGTQQVVDGVSFEMFKGRILALIGPNGAGKSSIMRILAGLVKSEKGEIHLHGKSLVRQQEIHRSAGFFIETPAFYKNLTAKQNLNLLQKIRGEKATTAELIDMVGLSDAVDKKVGKFSKGMKQRLGIAQALIGDPAILVLDEPFHGLDPEVKLFLKNLIKDLAIRENKAVLVSSHLLSDLENMANDFVLLHHGKIHLSGKLSDYRNERQRVTFWFEKNILNANFGELNIGNVCEDLPNCWEADLTIEETIKWVKRWGESGYIPYKIDREDLLHSKYMEITE